MKRLLIFFTLCILIGRVSAQVGGRLTQIVNTEQATYGQASYIAAVSAGLAQDTDSYERCFEILKEENCTSARHSLKDSITVKYFADMLCKTFSVNNSVAYRFVRVPRYAYKQLKAAGVIPDNYYPNRILSGSEMMNTLTLFVENYNISESN